LLALIKRKEFILTSLNNIDREQDSVAARDIINILISSDEDSREPGVVADLEEVQLYNGIHG
jgi:hypothetical protein